MKNFIKILIRNIKIITLQSVVIALIGFFCLSQLFNRILEHIPHNFIHLPTYAPIAFTLTWLLPIIGISLIFSAFYLLRRKQIAYFTSLIALAVLIGLSFFVRHASVFTCMLTLIIIWLFLSSKLYTLKSDVVSMRRGLSISFILLMIAVLYGVVGFKLLAISGFGRPISGLNSVLFTVQALIDSAPIMPTNRLGDLFLDSLNTVGISTLILSLGSLFKPVRFALYSSAQDRTRAEEVLQKNSTSTEDYFKLWPRGKHYFFTDDKKSFIAYGLSGRTVVIIGDPSGNKTQFDDLFTRFIDFAYENGWVIASINATQASDASYEKFGFNKLFIGNEAIINTQQFVDTETKSKHFRYVKNTAVKAGLHVEYWDTPSQSQVDLLLPVSRAWLTRSNKREYSFFMGYFDTRYLQSGSIIVLKQQETIIAYINVIPSFIKKSASIDHIRSLDTKSSVATHYLLMELIIHLNTLDVRTVSLGLAPLAGIEKKLYRTAQDRLLLIIKLLGGRYYSFKGLEQFKGKFRPDWQPSYLYYQTSPALLPFIARDIERLARHTPHK